MADENNGESSQPAESVTPQTSDAIKGRENVGLNQAVARMLKQEQARATQSTPSESVVPAEENATTTPSDTDAAQAPSAEETVAAEAPAEVPAESEDALSHEKPNLDPELKKWVSEKISERVRKKNEQLAALQAEVNSLKLAQQAKAQEQPETPTIVPLPEGAPPLANIQSADQLQTLAKQAKEAMRWAETQLDNDVGEVMLGNQTLGKADLKAIIRNAKLTLEDQIPQRQQFLNAREQARKTAFEMFPYLKDPSSPEYVQAQAARQHLSRAFQHEPNFDFIVGVQIEGLKAIKAKQEALAKKNGKAVVTTAKPPASQSVVGSNGSTGRVSVATKQAQETQGLRQFLSKKGGVTAAEAIAAQTKFEQSRSRQSWP